MLSFNPVKLARRAYTTVPPSDYDENSDPEKRASFDNESEYVSSPDSRSTFASPRQASGTYRPKSPRRSSSVTRKAKAYEHSSPRRYSRYFTLALFTTCVIFILWLVRSHLVSRENVRLGIGRRPPRPPAWEDFAFLKRNYGGIRTLVAVEKNKPEWPIEEDDAMKPAEAVKAEEQQGNNGTEMKSLQKRDSRPVPAGTVFSPYPDYASDAYREELGEVKECFMDAAGKVRIPDQIVHNGVPMGMPDHMYGSYSEFGLRDDICFDRFGRYGPYGMGYSKKRGGLGAGLEGDREGAEQVWAKNEEVDYTKVKWAEVQNRCAQANSHRFRGNQQEMPNAFQSMPEGASEGDGPTLPGADSKTEVLKDARAAKQSLPRTAVLVRTWHDYQYDDEDILALRAMIAELAIKSSGEYHVHFLIHVKDDNLPIWSDEASYASVLNASLPQEFKGMGTLWTERQMGLIYGGLEESMYRNLPVHGAYRSTYMPVSYFAHTHPEYDLFWHWEMDVRYIGHFYDLFSKVSKWADAQPRKNMWERSARFYVPHVHGSWDDFKHMVRVQTEHGTSSKNNIWAELSKLNPDIPESARHQGPEKPIWGPEPPLDDNLDTTLDPKVPHTMLKDHDEWGVGETADLIVFNPLFDPEGTNWILAQDTTGYNTTRGLPPRRTAINTSGRLSRRLLDIMHGETALHRHTMFSEMWPASAALHHGLKAVYAPHPVYIDRRWPPQYLAAIFNGGRNGASGGARTSVFSDERQHNFLGTTWYYHAGHAINLYKRWLGYKVDGGGGEAEEVSEEGRMCLRSVLLHPIKQVDLVELG
ncbi:hypothetical protein LTS18_000055 [Coniosporium uncinatum]|uniref:Uncharacterized protein n=1 Tax=Coniosporium uncinatum TaxID=93489 RepID=A0ACC3DDD3_9PEZI|nr:hypothetical protein LTS18_000055 [Coniosporium uncinatum]